MNLLGLEVERIQHACFKITGAGKVVYIDPYKLPEGSPKADVVLITHEHDDHLSIPDLEKILQESTVVVIAPITHPSLLDYPKDIFYLVVMGLNEKYFGEGFTVETIPSYNLDKFRSPGELYHPKGDERVGFVLTLAGVRVYHAGDTDLIPELSSLEKIDIALLPVSGTFVMTPEEAAQAVDIIKPKVAVPMHWGDIIGTRKDADKFQELSKSHVEIL